MAENKEYGAESIQVLHGLEAVRKRPGMYIGSTGPNGIHHLVYEVVDNSIDEAMAGYCDNIIVALEKDDICRVEDNGRGIPVAINSKEKKSALELVLSQLHAGGKFDKSTYKVSGGLHGVGVSCVNALSVWLTADVYRDGGHFFQKYETGIPKTKVERIEDSDKHGTVIRWKADGSIFKETTTYDFDVLISRLRELAFLNPGIKITFRDERLENPKEVVLKFEGGINEYTKYLNNGKKVIPDEPIYITGEQSDVIAEVSMQYNDSYEESIYSYVNDINTHEGGTHLEGFKNALTFVLNKALDGNDKLFKKLNPKVDRNKKPSDSDKKKEIKIERLTGDDVRTGIAAVVSVKVPEPQFEGQTKQKLGNTEVRSIVYSLVSEKLTLWFEQNPQLCTMILEKAVNEAIGRIKARKAVETNRKSGMDSFGLPGKLADCSSKNPEDCEVYIVEGDSAGGSAKQGRNPKTQAILPLWGKMLNVEKVDPSKVMNNEKLQPVIASLGTGIGKNFNIEKLRYHKIIIMADADVDGAHISTLLMTFFFRFMPELIEKGYVYIAMPPLYRVEYKKQKFKRFVFSDEERDKALADLGENRDKAEVQRYKGLGEMEWQELKETTMSPENRKMKQVKITDAKLADQVFSVLMGDDVDPRRKFIEENAEYATLDV
ncbi:MAG: DNA topoisomerase (ATP-hydrolyzing) subunit B [Treponema sp.]|nr:DNA topoisomerase (ATP-hydrolyzing) subunit B [Spirochaetia bacterium]MDD7459328.1 DNA topoisomerase (ATP-hydrolyzing) subunit B [Spirochaetales bacterium]MDY5811262.1 DNA topoisomerase (ATP-hydrolyzing) subunit B [Treponema sp.]MEE1181607.1 DNA topoisomerase (ATP-hydrolyzing) subunit B [Treponema sp.]